MQRTICDRNGKVVRLIRPNEYDPETDGGNGFQFTYNAQGRVLTVLSPEGIEENSKIRYNKRKINTVGGEKCQKVSAGIQYD